MVTACDWLGVDEDTFTIQDILLPYLWIYSGMASLVTCQFIRRKWHPQPARITDILHFDWAQLQAYYLREKACKVTERVKHY